MFSLCRTMLHRSAQSLKFVRQLSAQKVDLNAEKRLMSLVWEDGERTEHPMAWMRDNCQCDSCFNHVTKSRKLLMRQLQVRAEVDSVELSHKDDVISLKWKDGHNSVFDADFLRQRSFTPERQKVRDSSYHIPQQFWDAHSLPSPPQHQFSDVVGTEEGLLNWLVDLERFGIALIRNTPSQEEQLEKLLKLVSYPSQTNYGPFYKVRSKSNASNLAYTPVTLGLHLDLPFYEAQPGVQLLFCIQQPPEVEGGENEFVDGIGVARKMAKSHPEMYRVLESTLVDFYDYGTDFLPDFHMLQRQRVFHKDENSGEITRIHYNNQVRDTFLNIPADQVQLFYDALKTYDDMLYSKENLVEIKLVTGDIITFDNRRVMHGRKGYSCPPGVERYLFGTYLEWDEVRSRTRRLQEKLN